MGKVKKKINKKDSVKLKEISSPVCYANSDELREEFKEEVDRKKSSEN